MAKAGYICNHSVKMGGKYHAPNDPIEIKDEAEAARLLERGAIRTADEPAPAPAVVEVKVGEVQDDKAAGKKGSGK